MSSISKLRFRIIHRRLYILLLLTILLWSPTVTGVEFNQCLQEIKDGKWGQVGGTDNHGRPVPIADATAITYKLCTTACGTGSQGFKWSVFSQQFSSWLLPWFALVSQLPFGSNDKLNNLVSMFLTVGSPTLAAYSLVLTVLNGRWIARRFSSYTYPNTRFAIQILSSLQQSPLKITTDDSLLASLVVLPENDEWWNELVVWLDYTHTWSVSAVTSIAWVIIAYIFTVIDSFAGDMTTSINANGEGVGSLWIWLVPIVIGWLQISPKCDVSRVYKAVKRANAMAHVATPSHGPVLASSLSRQRAISLVHGDEDSLHHDEYCTVPIYNYARFLPWVQAVEEVSEAFRAASERAHLHRSVDPDVKWEKEESFAANLKPNSRNRTGNRAQVEAYCLPLGEPSLNRRSPWGPSIISRVVIASAIALALQWGTTGAATIVVWFTPVVGFGCRSGAYILYGAMSTVVWILLVLSSFLSHYASTTAHATYKHSAFLARSTSIFFRRLGKVLATCNAVWIVASCLFQFSNFFNRCYCNSSVLGRGIWTFDVIAFTPGDTAGMKGAWVGGVVLAAGSATLFVLFMNLFINPQLPDHD